MRSCTGPQHVFSSQRSQGKQGSFGIMTLPIQFHNLKKLGREGEKTTKRNIIYNLMVKVVSINNTFL